MALELAEGAHFTSLRDAVYSKTISCPTGTFELKQECTKLYYLNSRSGSPCASFVDFTNPSDDDLRALSEACDPATFGRADQDVYDESYRKAGKLDTTHFAVNFHPGPAGLLNDIRDVLLEGCDLDTDVTAELYKLNVYGPGSFFKAHKDTPRGPTMFASLVVVLPTKHEGGALMFRHEDQEIKFDSALALAGENKPAVAYAAFFSDVEHEVEEVRSGYRVTLTYNLYRTTSRRSGQTLPQPVDGYVSRLADTFRELLNDETFLPDGGLVGFGLRHDYPMFTDNIDGLDLCDLYGSLKGSDALLAQVCDRLRLESQIKIVYHSGDDESRYVLSADMLSDLEFHDSTINILLKQSRGQQLISDPLWGEYYDDESDWCTYVYWATPVSPHMSKKVCVVYGNEPIAGIAYGRACLIVKVKSYRRRVRMAAWV
ncbi:hypothetical protein BDW22DRAFT_894553 [Trametopsis cervina]|nr:hypothetical protein BDW22DRAFT_894553 [Trametopsis cervina]